MVRTENEREKEERKSETKVNKQKEYRNAKELRKIIERENNSVKKCGKTDHYKQR